LTFLVKKTYFVYQTISFIETERYLNVSKNLKKPTFSSRTV